MSWPFVFRKSSSSCCDASRVAPVNDCEMPSVGTLNVSSVDPTVGNARFTGIPRKLAVKAALSVASLYVETRRSMAARSKPLRKSSAVWNPCDTAAPPLTLSE